MDGWMFNPGTSWNFQALGLRQSLCKSAVMKIPRCTFFLIHTEQQQGVPLHSERSDNDPASQL